MMWHRELSPEEHQLVGLIMGEGCFSFGAAHTNCPSPEFQLTMTETELPQIQQARQLLGIGLVHRLSAKKRTFSRPFVTWAVTKDRDVLKVVELCEHCHLRSMKALELPHVREAIRLRAIDNPNSRVGGRYREWTCRQVRACWDAIKEIRRTGRAVPVVTDPNPHPTFWEETGS